MSNDNVSPNQIIASAAETYAEDVECQHILYIQDTTEILYPHRDETFPGLGPTSKKDVPGFFAHTSMLVDANNGQICGLGEAHFYNREWGQNTTACDRHKNVPIEAKESFKWIYSGMEGLRRLAHVSRKTIVADREADMYPLFWYHKKGKFGEGSEVLVRAYRNRKVDDGIKYIHDVVKSWGIKSKIELDLTKSRKHGNRVVSLELRFGQVKLLPPNHNPSEYTEEITAWCIDVIEVNEIQGKKPLHWRILTTWRTETVEDAVQRLKWYAMRWSIEELFRVLKSSARIREAQFETGKALMNWMALNLILACRTLTLKTLRDSPPEVKAYRYLTDTELKVLEYAKEKWVSTNSQYKFPPKHSLQWAILLVAIAGGYNLVPSAGPPGQKCLWQGLQWLQGASTGYEAAMNICG